MTASSSENPAMHPFAYLAAIHVQELIDEAAIERRGRLVRKGQSRVPAWRRSLGGLFVSAARSIDPTIEATGHNRRSTEGGGARAIAA